MFLGEFTKHIDSRLDYVIVVVDENESELDRYPIIAGYNPNNIPTELQNLTIINIDILHDTLHIYISK